MCWCISTCYIILLQQHSLLLHQVVILRKVVHYAVPNTDCRLQVHVYLTTCNTYIFLGSALSCEWCFTPCLSLGFLCLHSVSPHDTYITLAYKCTCNSTFLVLPRSEHLIS